MSIVFVPFRSYARQNVTPLRVARFICRSSLLSPDELSFSVVGPEHGTACQQNSS